MTSNSEEFDAAYSEALQHLEDEDTDMFLMATAKPNGDIHSQYAHNDESPLPPEQVVPMLASLVVCVNQQTEEPIEALLADVSMKVSEIRRQHGGDL